MDASTLSAIAGIGSAIGYTARQLRLYAKQRAHARLLDTIYRDSKDGAMVLGAMVQMNESDQVRIGRSQAACSLAAIDLTMRSVLEPDLRQVASRTLPETRSVPAQQEQQQPSTQ